MLTYAGIYKKPFLINEPYHVFVSTAKQNYLGITTNVLKDVLTLHNLATILTTTNIHPTHKFTLRAFNSTLVM